MGHILKTKLKVLLRTKVIIFWTLIFPIVLSTFFNLAFSNLTKEEGFEVIDIAVVDDDNFKKEESFNTLVKELSKKEDNQVFKTKYVSLKEAEKLLNDNKIEGYYIVKDKIEVVIKRNGVGPTIMEYALNSYYQTTSIIKNIYEYDATKLSNDIFEKLNTSPEFFSDSSSSNLDYTVVYFYTLIGMVCLYGGFFGINSVVETEANLSTRGARLNIAPTNKAKVLIANIIASLIIQYSEFLIFFAYISLVLKISFGSQTLLILLLALCGSIAGIGLGIFIGAINRKSEEVKISIFLSVVMSMSFLSGMMYLQMKYIIATYAPIIGYINPVNMITDALYSLYYYTTLDRYLFNLVSLNIFSLVMFLISYLILRRKKYDSI